MKKYLVQKIKAFFLSLLKLLDPLGFIAVESIRKDINNEYIDALFVNSRGLMLCCEIHNTNTKTDSDWIDFDLDSINQGTKSIYINTDASSSFYKKILPGIVNPLLLVVGNSDKSFGYEGSVNKILESEKITALFAQNLEIEHPKVFPLPIGLDYHNIWEKPRKNSLGYRITPLLHERFILKTLASSVNLDNRKNLLYCNWHFKIDRGDRRACYEGINHELCFFEQSPVNRLQNYSNQSKFRYVLSPSGLGSDCYRTWEAIILGCIPVIRRSNMSNYFKHLPVIIVNEWHEITFEFLEARFNEMKKIEFDYGFIFMDFWKRAIDLHNLPSSYPDYMMTLDAYRNKYSVFKLIDK